MPTSMRGNGVGTRTQVQRPVGRYFPGKGAAQQESDDEDDDDDGEQAGEQSQESEEEARPLSTAKIDVNLKDVDLARHYEQETILDETRQAASRPGEQDGSSNYETDEEAEESGSESDSEVEEEAPRRVLAKPVFMTKAQREALNKDTKQDVLNPIDQQPADDLDEIQRKRLASRTLLQESIRAEAASKLRPAQDFEDVDDTDDIDPVAEKAAWRLRELLRIKRDREALEQRERERDEIEARRAMPEDQRLAEDLQRVREENEAKATERKALHDEGAQAQGQKFHHVGAFYQDDETVQRAKKQSGVVENTGSGHGLKGATRWTGLKNQDTSRPVDARDSRDYRTPSSGMREGAAGSSSYKNGHDRPAYNAAERRDSRTREDDASRKRQRT